jgi:hypothetical protein
MRMTRDGAQTSVSRSRNRGCRHRGGSPELTVYCNAVSFDDNINVQYAVESLSFEGHATLAAGVTRTVSAQSCIQGATSERSPFDMAEYTNTDVSFRRSFSLPNPAPAESECGASGDVNITTRLNLRNDAGQPAQGSLRLFTTDACHRPCHSARLLNASSPRRAGCASSSGAGAQRWSGRVCARRGEARRNHGGSRSQYVAI